MVDRLDKQQLDEVRQVFSTFDHDKDGTMSAREFKSAMESVGVEIKDEDLDHWIAEVDADGNGAIDFPEFLILMARGMRDQCAEVKEAFGVFDKDGNGLVSRAELSHVMTSLGIDAAQEVEDLIRLADADGDDHVNYDEFVNVVLRTAMPSPKISLPSPTQGLR